MPSRGGKSFPRGYQGLPSGEAGVLAQVGSGQRENALGDPGLAPREMEAVFLFPKEASARSREILEDDLVSRQSVTLRDARALGVDQDGTLVFIQGDPGVIERFESLAEEAAERLGEDQAASLRAILRKEEEDAAEGVGLLFGGT